MILTISREESDIARGFRRETTTALPIVTRDIRIAAPAIVGTSGPCCGPGFDESREPTPPDVNDLLRRPVKAKRSSRRMDSDRSAHRQPCAIEGDMHEVETELDRRN